MHYARMSKLHRLGVLSTRFCQVTFWEIVTLLYTRLLIGRGSGDRGSPAVARQSDWLLILQLPCTRQKF